MSHLWHALASEDPQLLRTALTNLPDAPASATWLNYVRSHDDIGWGLADADVRAVGQTPTDTRRTVDALHSGGEERLLSAGPDRTFLVEREHEAEGRLTQYILVQDSVSSQQDHADGQPDAHGVGREVLATYRSGGAGGVVELLREADGGTAGDGEGEGIAFRPVGLVHEHILGRERPEPAEGDVLRLVAGEPLVRRRPRRPQGPTQGTARRDPQGEAEP